MTGGVWADLKFEVQNLKSFKKIANIEKRVIFVIKYLFVSKYALLKNDHVFEMLVKETNNGSKIV